MTKDVNKLFRLRPASDNTIEELTEEYLWFSRPSGFNDKGDANIAAFIKENETFQTALKRILNEKGVKELAEKSKYIGICCFTEKLPSNWKDWKQFPHGLNSICIQYDRGFLSSFFSRIGKQEPFVRIEYVKNPLIFETDNGITYLKENIGECGYRLHNVDGAIRYDWKRGLDKIISLLLTRLDERFSGQHEVRVYLGGIHIPSCNDNIHGYKFPVCNGCIDKVVVPQRVSDKYPDFVAKLEGIKNLKGKLVYCRNDNP